MPESSSMPVESGTGSVSMMMSSSCSTSELPEEVSCDWANNTPCPWRSVLAWGGGQSPSAAKAEVPYMSAPMAPARIFAFIQPSVVEWLT
ncbi:hypothetical protein MFU01_17900 [Myxococcus fulvus]|uniref:Uncharacterized protein n=1 Tax=Myxococcus fulvus TaxID=33 RepID=A0A511SZK6_MYXFU|nr:hypothetical protein MFU01_17900 [Myxococcus fulvus]